MSAAPTAVKGARAEGRPPEDTPLDTSEVDAVLRAQLHHGLNADAARGDHAEALQARVIAQWRQRHPLAETRFAPAGGTALNASEARHRHLRWWAAGTLLSAALLLGVASWQQRPDPALDELMQMDVLTLLSMGEI